MRFTRGIIWSYLRVWSKQFAAYRMVGFCLLHMYTYFHLDGILHVLSHFQILLIFYDACRYTIGVIVRNHLCKFIFFENPINFPCEFSCRTRFARDILDMLDDENRHKLLVIKFKQWARIAHQSHLLHIGRRNWWNHKQPVFNVIIITFDLLKRYDFVFSFLISFSGSE